MGNRIDVLLFYFELFVFFCFLFVKQIDSKVYDTTNFGEILLHYFFFVSLLILILVGVSFTVAGTIFIQMICGDLHNTLFRLDTYVYCDMFSYHHKPGIRYCRLNSQYQNHFFQEYSVYRKYRVIMHVMDICYWNVELIRYFLLNLENFILFILHP